MGLNQEATSLWWSSPFPKHFLWATAASHGSHGCEGTLPLPQSLGRFGRAGNSSPVFSCSERGNSLTEFWNALDFVGPSPRDLDICYDMWLPEITTNTKRKRLGMNKNMKYTLKNYHDNGKSPCLVGDTSSNGCFSTVMLLFGGAHEFPPLTMVPRYSSTTKSIILLIDTSGLLGEYHPLNLTKNRFPWAVGVFWADFL